MSHMVTLKSSMKNIDALRLACKALDIPAREGRHTVQLYSSQKVETEFSFKLPGWQYPCAVDMASGQVKMDNFNGHWGKIEEFDKLHQEYGLQVAEREPSVQEKVNEGWQVERVPQENGKVRLRVFETAGAY